MSWDSHHSESEEFASVAETAARQGDTGRAVALYKSAAEAELRALKEVSPTKTRTLGVTAVSAVALYYKAGEYQTARDIAQQWLRKDGLPSFAHEQLKEFLASTSITSVQPSDQWLKWVAGITVMPVIGSVLSRSYAERQVTGLEIDWSLSETPQFMIALCLIVAAMALCFLKYEGKILASLLFGAVIVFFYNWNVSTRAIKVNTGLTSFPQAGWIGNLWFGAGWVDLFVLIISAALLTVSVYLLWRNRGALTNRFGSLKPSSL